MDIGHKSGSKERLFEMMERVNKVTLNESFDSPKEKDEKYLDHTVDPKGNQDNKYDDGVRYPVEEPLKVDDESLEGLKGDDLPLDEEHPLADTMDIEVDDKEEDKLLKPSEHWIDHYAPMNVGEQFRNNDGSQPSYDEIVNGEFVYDGKGNYRPKNWEDKQSAIRPVEQPMGSGNQKYLIVRVDNNGNVIDTYDTKDTFEDAKKGLAAGLT